MYRQFEKKLTFLLYGMKGGQNRINIINALQERPYNMNQLSNKLGLNYRTIKHHIDILLKEELLTTAKKGKYGNVFFISPDLEANWNIFEKILNKINKQDYLKEYVQEINFYERVIREMNVGVILVDNDNNPFFSNGAASGIFGLSPQDILEQQAEPVKSVLLENKELNKAMEDKGTIKEYITEFEDRDGNVRYVNVRVSPIKSRGMEPVGKSFLVTDITEKKLDEDRIRHLQTLSQAIFDNIPLGINIKGPDFVPVFQNKKMDEMFGRIKDKECFKHYWKRNKPCRDCQMIQSFENGEVHSIIAERDDDRQYLIIQVPFEGDKVLEILQDITDEKMFEETLIETQNLYNDIIDNISDDMVIVNLKDMKIEMANQHFLKNNGGKKKVLGRKCYEVLHDRKTKCKQDNQCGLNLFKKKKKATSVTHTHVDKNGKPFDVKIKTYPIKEHDGKVERVILMMMPEK
jgi:PAS domain S-box-containing protein